MAAFDKITSGLPGLDLTLDWIRLGDNVVWQVSSVSDYQLMVKPFVETCLHEGRQLIYIRFAPHAPILEPRPDLIIHELDPSLGFESFTSNVHKIIKDAGKEAFYIFDCLSDLQTAWAADLMMGNFFMVTCPYLFELDTVAWFCILRKQHSYDTIARIRETTQLFLDLFPDDECLYLHPIKVWKRYSPTMFFPHRICLSIPQEILPLTDGVSVSRFYQIVELDMDQVSTRNLDSWERFFMNARDLAESNTGFPDELIHMLAERLIGSEVRLLDLAKKNCSIKDFLNIKERMIGSGKIGGKAAGMLLSRNIVQRKLPQYSELIEPHDSFYIGSDVFYTYLVQNNLWKLRILQRTDGGYFKQAPKLRKKILAGAFSAQIREEFMRCLEYFGQNPIIVRSSSLLEDSFGHAFAGKYESVFCVNTGSPEDRLKAFESAVKVVYASTMDPSALAYRQQRDLHKQDEQMAILVQRVSGSLFTDFFMPVVAGVGYSFNTWRWHRDLSPEAGMIRLVAGLGTRAVDRTGSDYPRIVSLDRPELDPAGSADRGRYSQHSFDGLDLVNKKLQTREVEDVLSIMPPWFVNLVLERDLGAERRLEDVGAFHPVYISTCSGVVAKTEFLAVIGAIMQTLQVEYGNPVDIEFTVNWTEKGEYLLNLLQCRPLQILKIPVDTDETRIDELTIASLAPDSIFFYQKRNTMGPQLNQKIDAVILIDPHNYYEMPYKEKPSVSRVVGDLNRYYRDKKKTVMLLSPGRIGTTSQELGLTVTFAEIADIKILCEIAYSAAGYQPELSFGSHFFQDLVEAEMFYTAISEDSDNGQFHPEFFKDSVNMLNKVCPEHNLPDNVAFVYEPHNLVFFSDILRGSCLCANVLDT